VSDVDFGLDVLESDNTTQFQYNVMVLLAQFGRDLAAMKEEMRQRNHRDPRGMR